MAEAPGAAAFTRFGITVELHDVAEGHFVEELDEVGGEQALLAELVAEEFVLENGEPERFH